MSDGNGASIGRLIGATPEDEVPWEEVLEVRVSERVYARADGGDASLLCEPEVLVGRGALRLVSESSEGVVDSTGAVEPSFRGRCGAEDVLGPSRFGANLECFCDDLGTPWREVFESELIERDAWCWEVLLAVLSVGLICTTQGEQASEEEKNPFHITLVDRAHLKIVK